MQQVIALSSLQRAMRFGAGVVSETTFRAASQNRLVSNREVEIEVRYPIGITERMIATRTMYGKLIVPAAAQSFPFVEVPW